MGQLPGVPSKSLHHLVDVLHLRWRGETVANVLTPFGEIRGAAKIDRVVLHRLPFHEQPVARRLLDRALQRQACAALGALEHWRGLCDAGLELRFHAGLYVDLGDLENHELSFRCVRYNRNWPTTDNARQICPLRVWRDRHSQVHSQAGRRTARFSRNIMALASPAATTALQMSVRTLSSNG